MKRKLKKKAVIALCVVSGIVFILSGSVFFFYQSYKMDIRKTNEQVQKIKEIYDPFKDAVLNFSAQREKIYEDVFAHKYFVDVNTNNEKWQNDWKAYEESIQAVIKTTSELTDLCQYNYIDQDAQNKCEAFYILYEQSNNYFVKDFEEFKKFIEEFNEWTKDNPDYQKVEVYQLSGTYQYVDLNHDQIFTGKDET